MAFFVGADQILPTKNDFGKGLLATTVGEGWLFEVGSVSLFIGKLETTSVFLLKVRH